MIIILVDFCQFSGRKLAFFSKTNVMINFFKKLAVVGTKNANIFTKFFSENIFKIITSLPGTSPTIASYNASVAKIYHATM
jgi:hypothetical protein